jgi:hypothetical protein
MSQNRVRLEIMLITVVVLSTSVAQAQSTGPQGVVDGEI